MTNTKTNISTEEALRCIVDLVCQHGCWRGQWVNDGALSANRHALELLDRAGLVKTIEGAWHRLDDDAIAALEKQSETTSTTAR